MSPCADVQPSAIAKGQGFPVCLYLDAATQEYVEEFSTSNFLGVTQEGTLVTPLSESILPSCTKRVLLQQARDMGITVEERPVRWDEVKSFREVRPPVAPHEWHSRFEWRCGDAPERRALLPWATGLSTHVLRVPTPHVVDNVI